MNVHVLLHAPFEGLGSIDAWLHKRGASIQYTRFYDSGTLPDLTGVDFVIAMGGPMSVNDEQQYPWLKQEKAFIYKAICQDVPVLGVCLGAQLIANSFGARVFPNRYKEIGWFPIEAVHTDSDRLPFPKQTTAFHWHGETFDLPKGAVPLARSAGCENQAFQIGRNVIGLQCHLETTPETLALMIENNRGEWQRPLRLIEDKYIQTENAMRNVPESAYSQINNLMDNILSYVTSAAV